MAIFEIKNLNFTYARAKCKAIDNLSLKIEAGSFCVICGKSGSGKSTLIRLLKNEVAPQGELSGEILYDNIPLKCISDRVSVTDIGFVHQDVDSGLVCDKVWKELAFGLGNLGYNDDYIGARIAEISEYFGISKWYNKKISELSGGSKQIVSLASVMTMNPKVLLLDEPTSMLDPISKKNFINLLNRINKELGITIIMVEHNLESVFDIASNIIVLDSGKLIANCTPYCLPKSLVEYDCLKYIGLPEFAEVYTLFGNEKMPNTIENKRAWLKSVIGDSNQNLIEKVDNNFNNENVLTAENLYFRYDKKGEDIVKGASIKLNKGEIICLLGGNGGGKTTFINLLNGIFKAYSGKVKIDKNCKVATLPQNAKGLFVESSVENELSVFAKLLKIDKDKVQSLLEKFDLIGIREQHPYDISGGEVQRLALAKLFLVNPDILILDEPTQCMDMLSKEYLINLLLQSKIQGKSVIVVTHDLRFTSMIADKVGMFFDGKIVALDSASNFFESNNIYTTESSYLTRDFEKGLYSVEKIINRIKNNLC